MTFWCSLSNFSFCIIFWYLILIFTRENKKNRKNTGFLFCPKERILGSAVHVLNTKIFAVPYISIFDFEEFKVNAYRSAKLNSYLGVKSGEILLHADLLREGARDANLLGEKAAVKGKTKA
jgi:hypothetical protein